MARDGAPPPKLFFADLLYLKWSHFLTENRGVHPRLREGMLFPENALNPPFTLWHNVKERQPPIAVRTSATPSWLAHSAGPAAVPISQPAGSTSSVIGNPNARPTSFRS
jgi:hypothetical protein